MQALKRRFKRSAEDEADDPDADIQRGMWKNHKLLPPSRKSKMMGKGKASFRMIERVGACVGVCSPYDMPWRAPFTVTAVKQAQLFALQSSAMVSVLSHFLDHDEQVVLKNMEKEEQMHIKIIYAKPPKEDFHPNLKIF